jgi:hypothetical protein
LFISHPDLDASLAYECETSYTLYPVSTQLRIHHDLRCPGFSYPDILECTRSCNSLEENE